MPVRQQNWNQYEAVILLEGYLDIHLHGLPRNEVVERISCDLRTMALNQGCVIDDIYRNSNGIAFQIRSMESAYQGRTIMKPASKLFKEIVSLYRNSPEAYAKLRKEAEKMIEGTNNEQKFMNYLSTQVSPSLFAEFILYYTDIETFCLKVNVLKNPLFETTDIDIIKRVRCTIEQNKIFKITHKRDHAKIVAACRYYYTYVLEKSYEDAKVSKDLESMQRGVFGGLTTQNLQVFSQLPDLDIVRSSIEITDPLVPTESFEDIVRNALQRETEENDYGTTIDFLQRQIHCADRAKIKSILSSATWARYQFGRYFYITQEENVDVAHNKETVLPNGQKDLIDRTEEDHRLLQKYPIVYKRLFSGLRELSETHPHGVSVAELYTFISRVGRPAAIEEILDNVSWAVTYGCGYLFSEEKADQYTAISYEGEGPLENPNSATIEKTDGRDVLLVDFDSVGELSNTNPEIFAYFEEEQAADTWGNLYVSLFATICEDYPHVFHADMSFSESRGKLDLVQANAAEMLMAPRIVPGTAYALETNLSANSIIPKLKYILDLCNIDYENVVIKYRKNRDALFLNPLSAVPTQNGGSTSAQNGNATYGTFSTYLQSELQMAERTVYNYAAAINVCENIAYEEEFTNWRLYSEDTSIALKTIELLKSNAAFIEKNRNRHNQLSAALTKFTQFINGTDVFDATEHTPGTAISTKKVEPYQNKLYEAVLENNFKKGFRMDSPLEIRKFRRYYQAIHNAELSDTDEVVTDIIKRLCILHDGKAFLPAVILSEELKEKLLHYIDACFDEGRSAIYYQAIYTEFSEEFLDYHIYDSEMLKAYLTVVADGRFYINKSNISKQANVTLDPLSEIRSCLQAYGRPVEYEELYSALPHLPQSKVKLLLASNGEFINNGHGTYFHESVIQISSEELEGIADIIAYTINEKEFMGGNELYDAIKTKYPHIIESNQVYSVYGVRDALKYKLGDRFSFKGNIISSRGQELSMSDVFANYAQHHDSFSLTELQALATELSTMVYFEPVYENSLRVSQEQFVSKNHAHFPVADTDAALDLICTGNYISIRDVTNFAVLPYAGFPWNSYLLEHYVAEYSKRYMLLHSNYNSAECAGAIVKRSAGIKTFDDFIVELLASNDVELKKAPALQFLSDNGYLARRRYGNIESLLIKANAKRNRKDTD